MIEAEHQPYKHQWNEHQKQGNSPNEETEKRTASPHKASSKYHTGSCQNKNRLTKKEQFLLPSPPPPKTTAKRKQMATISIVGIFIHHTEDMIQLIFDHLYQSPAPLHKSQWKILGTIPTVKNGSPSNHHHSNPQKTELNRSLPTIKCKSMNNMDQLDKYPPSPPFNFSIRNPLLCSVYLH